MNLVRILAICTVTTLFAVWDPVDVLAQTSGRVDLTAAERAYVKAKGHIKVCVDPSRMPFDGLNEHGAHDGLSGDYFKVFAGLLHVPMVLHPVQNWAELMAAAKNRDCDVVSQINASEDRKAFLDFSTPYLNLPLAVVTRSDRIFVEESLEGSGAQFAVVAGDIAINKLRTRYPGIDLVEVKNNVEGLTKVSDREVFGYIGAQGAVVFAMQSQNMKNLAVTGGLPLIYDLGVATRNDEPLLGAVFEKAIQAVDPKDGQRMRNKWIAITIKQVTDYTLLWQVLIGAAVLLSVSFYWNRRLTRANQKIRDTLSQLNDTQILLEQQNQKLKEQSTTDQLTKVYNRVKIDQVMSDETQRANRTKTAFGIILLDADEFKKVNDTHGHPVGDEVLKTFANLLKTSVRTVDVVGRWGGEEFLIICPGTDDLGCRALAENLRSQSAQCAFPVAGPQTASFGIAVHQPGERAEALIERADQALYRSKENGRNRVEFSPPR